jgi:dihydroneopterin aldolase
MLLLLISKQRESSRQMGRINTKLFLEDYEVDVNIGIHNFEKKGPQRILINIEIVILEEDLSNDDSISSVLDYDFLRIEIKKLIAERRFNLQETLCRSILDIVKNQPGIQKVIVQTKKPDVYLDCKGVGVEMEYNA